MRFLHPASIAAALSLLNLSSGAAHADAAGDKALAAVDAALNRADSHYFEYEASNQEAGKPEKMAGVNVYIKGAKRHVELTSPADLKGTKVLVLSPSEMYVYLPAFGKVRRIASHTTDQGMFGMAFSQDDLALQQYSAQYTATQSGDKLTLVPRSGQTTPYGKIELVVLKDKGLPGEIRYYGADGKLVKTETRTDYSCGSGAQQGVCSPGKLKMVDHTKNLTTTMTRKVWKVNIAISDDQFSKRNLEK